MLTARTDRDTSRRVRPRALIAGLILVVPSVYWVVQMERARLTAWPTAYSLFFHAVFILLVLGLLNRIVRWLAPSVALTQAELLLVYSMISVASGIAGIDFIQSLMPILSYSFWTASPENNWNKILNPYMPQWLTVRDLRAIRGFYEGGTDLYQPHILTAWAVPVLMWTLFIGLLVLVMICISALIRRRWLDEEHLDCPLTYLPVELSKPRVGLLGSGAFWAGFALVAAIETWNGISFYYPALPRVNMEPANLAETLRGRPWSAIGWTPVTFYPFLVGIGYLMPSDFLLSSWVFYVFWKAQFVVSDGFGVYGPDQNANFPFANFQAVGAYLLFAIYSLWLGREYLGRLWSAIIGLRTTLRADREPLGFRLAAIGLVAGLVGLLWFSVAMGMGLWVAVGVFVIYYAYCLAVSRMRVQFGAPIHDLHLAGPEIVLTSLFGSSAFSRQDLIGLAIYYWFNRAYRSNPMPHQLEAMSLQQRTGGSHRGLAGALLLAAVVGAFVTFWSFLAIYYDLGAEAKGGAFNLNTFPRLTNWLTAPKGPQWSTAPAILAGLVVAFGLQTLRMRYVNWPLHPLGYALAGGWQMNLVWMPLLIAWAIKVTVTRYGGYKTYERVRPFFLGAILGDFVVISVVNIIAIILRVPCYRFVD